CGSHVRDSGCVFVAGLNDFFPDIEVGAVAGARTVHAGDVTGCFDRIVVEADRVGVAQVFGQVGAACSVHAGVEGVDLDGAVFGHCFAVLVDGDGAVMAAHAEAARAGQHVVDDSALVVRGSPGVGGELAVIGHGVVPERKLVGVGGYHRVVRGVAENTDSTHLVGRVTYYQGHVME